MDAIKVSNIVKQYEEKTLSYFEASLELVMLGCTSSEVVALLK